VSTNTATETNRGISASDQFQNDGSSASGGCNSRREDFKAVGNNSGQTEEAKLGETATGAE
jgi:hypothetical protein